MNVLHLHSGMVLTQDKRTIYVCTTENVNVVSKYSLNIEEKCWEKAEDLPRSLMDDTEVVLQMRLDKHEKVLFGKHDSDPSKSKLQIPKRCSPFATQIFYC